MRRYNGASEVERAEANRRQRDELAERFEEVAPLLRTLDVDTIWDEATPAERRMLVEDLVDAVVVYPDHLQVEWRVLRRST